MDEQTERSAPPQRRRGAPVWILLAAVIAVIGALLYFHDEYRASTARTAGPGPAAVPGK
jgi:predicted outer membrane lipoprotein